jgi:hypothetical protein
MRIKRGREIAVLRCLLLAGEEDEETHGGINIVERALQYGKAMKIRRAEVERVLSMRVEDFFDLDPGIW